MLAFSIVPLPGRVFITKYPEIVFRRAQYRECFVLSHVNKLILAHIVRGSSHVPIMHLLEAIKYLSLGIGLVSDAIKLRGIQRLRRHSGADASNSRPGSQ